MYSMESLLSLLRNQLPLLELQRDTMPSTKQHYYNHDYNNHNDDHRDNHSDHHGDNHGDNDHDHDYVLDHHIGTTFTQDLRLWHRLRLPESRRWCTEVFHPRHPIRSGLQPLGVV